MKQFQKFGVAAAVASVAAGAVATDVSRSETGDLAIIPYYTVMDGVNTGMHIINTTGSTQVVKVRLRRGTDSKDALDFNLVMSPYDEWTANIGAGGPNGVLVTTNDTTCTVPEFPAGGAPMPETFSEGATEGYVEIIAMAQTIDEDQPIAVGAEHDEGTPADCAAVRQNFYRVAVDDVADAAVRGTHTSNLTSNGACASEAEADGNTACAAAGLAANLSSYEDSSDNALKVSFMLTDPAGGLEAGDNAVMVEGFADAAMMTNQQPLSFGLEGVLKYDPLNFELPNLAYGAYASSNATRQAAMAADGSGGTAGAGADLGMTDGTMWANLSHALDADSIANDWAAFSTADGTVHADWVVTLPGQYVMTNPICDAYTSYSEAALTASVICGSDASSTVTAIAALWSSYSAAGGSDRNQLPLIVASNDGGDPLIGDGSIANLNLWDREEMRISGTDEEIEQPDDELGFSPGGSVGTPGVPEVPVILPYEVNVIAFGDADSSTAVMSDLKLSVTPPEGSDRGWARLDIQSSNDDPERWNLAGYTDDGDLSPLTVVTNEAGFPIDAEGNITGDLDEMIPSLDVGTFTDVVASDVGVVGFAIWQRSFAEQAGNYGRMVEHSTIASSGGTVR